MTVKEVIAHAKAIRQYCNMAAIISYVKSAVCALDLMLIWRGED